MSRAGPEVYAVRVLGVGLAGVRDRYPRHDLVDPPLRGERPTPMVAPPRSSGPSGPSCLARI